jgi:hypothetical protein
MYITRTFMLTLLDRSCLLIVNLYMRVAYIISHLPKQILPVLF